MLYGPACRQIHTHDIISDADQTLSNVPQPSMNRPPIRILSNLARAGGTLVSRCLGAMDNIVLLSEIHPLGTQLFNPLEQAHDWYKLIQSEETGRQYNFIDTIQLVEQRCRTSGKTLVIRDWAHLDFIGVPFLKRPSYRKQLNKALAGAFDVRQYALVRHPADQWLSTARLKVMEGHLDLEAFLAGYRRFAEQATASGFMRYEDFTREPVTQIEQLCQQLQLDFDAGFINKWSANSHVTGDISGMSRGSRFAKICPLQRRSIDKTLQATLQKNPDYCQALELLGYTDPVSTV